ncbi:MAG TPA: ATP-binding protein [Gaiellaceae bacterium]|nr:ATP-binding protein [Gaiellaceae bacterium]
MGRTAHNNPYAPGAGTPPPALTGRQAELAQFALLLDRLVNGQPEKSIILTGQRGIGKTVLLERFAEIASESGWFHDYYEVTSAASLPAAMARMSRRVLLGMSLKERLKERATHALRVLKAFTLSIGTATVNLDVDAALGMADSGDLAEDLRDLLVEIGEVAAAGGTGVVFFLDEVQFVDKHEYEALIVALHRVAQKRLPVAIVAAGLPLLPQIGAKAKPYAERMFDYREIGRLPRSAADAALVLPAQPLGISYAHEALELIYELTEGYAYFLQEYGRRVWLVADEGEVTRDQVEFAHPVVQQYLDEGFFDVRMGGLSRAKRKYLSALADLGDGPQRAANVTARAGYRTAQQAAPIRDALIKEALVYVPERGELDFTVPQCAAYMRRVHPLTDFR